MLIFGQDSSWKLNNPYSHNLDQINYELCYWAKIRIEPILSKSTKLDQADKDLAYFDQIKSKRSDVENRKVGYKFFDQITWKNGILLPKLFWPTVRKKCSSDREKLWKFKAEGQEFANFLRSLEQFIQTVKGQNNFC